MRDHLIEYLDATENLMIFLMEKRDHPNSSKREVILCNRLYNACKNLYLLVKTVIRKEI